MTAAQRPYAWAKYLHKWGFYPIVISRSWNKEVNQIKDIYEDAPGEILHEKFDTHEVYRLPYKASFQEKTFRQWRYTSKNVLYFPIRVFYTIAEKFSNNYISSTPLLEQAEKIIESDDIKAILISTNPYHLFKFGYQLNKKYKIPFFADYRDDWTTNLNRNQTGLFSQLQNRFEAYFEKKWLSAASMFSSVTPQYTQRIKSLTGVHGFTQYNGYIEEEFTDETVVLFEEFTMTFSGTLYPSQNIEILLDGVKRFLDNNPEAKFKVCFLGAKFEKAEAERILSAMKGYESYVELTDRIPKTDAIKFQRQSHALVQVAYDDLKGWIGSKIFDYMATKKPILFCPADGSVQEKLLNDTGLLYSAKSAEEVSALIGKWYKLWQNGKEIPVDINEDYIKNYSREHQCSKLAYNLNQIISE